MVQKDHIERNFSYLVLSPADFAIDHQLFPSARKQLGQ
jgi:hypothetical protein